MLQPEYRCWNNGRKVAELHNAIKMCTPGSEAALKLYDKMATALDNLMEAHMAYDEWKAGQN